MVNGNAAHGDGADGTGRAQVLAGAASDAVDLGDGRNLVLEALLLHHADGAGRTVVGAVAAAGFALGGEAELEVDMCHADLDGLLLFRLRVLLLRLQQPVVEAPNHFIDNQGPMEIGPFFM